MVRNSGRRTGAKARPARRSSVSLQQPTQVGRLYGDRVDPVDIWTSRGGVAPAHEVR
jgi:hypothetical protein